MAAIVDLKARSLEIQRNQLLKQLQRLLSKFENPQLTREQLDQVKLDLAECQKRYQELGLG